MSPGSRSAQRGMIGNLIAAGRDHDLIGDVSAIASYRA